MAASPAMLDELSDLVFVCAGGVEIPATRFNCLATCEVLRNLKEDVGFAGPDARGRAVVPLHGIEPEPVRAAVDLLHGVRLVSQMSSEDLDVAFRGVDVLGLDVLLPSLTERLWALLSPATRCEDILPHLPRLLRDEHSRLEAVTRLVQLEPLWTHFHAKVFPHLAKDAALAPWLLTRLSKLFPANRVALALLEALQARGGSADDAARLLAGGGGMLYHPTEVPALLRSVAACTGASEGPRGLCLSMMQALIDYDPTPTSATHVHGSILLFDKTPHASALVLLEPSPRGVARHRRVRASSWLQLELTPHEDGGVDLDLLFRLGPLLPHRRAADVQLRVLCDRESARPAAGPPEAEAWYVFDGVPTRGAARRLDQAVLRMGSTPATVRRALREIPRGNPGSELARAVRVDVFFGPHSVLQRPF